MSDSMTASMYEEAVRKLDEEEEQEKQRKLWDRSGGGGAVVVETNAAVTMNGGAGSVGVVNGVETNGHAESNGHNG